MSKLLYRTTLLRLYSRAQTVNTLKISASKTCRSALSVALIRPYISIQNRSFYPQHNIRTYTTEVTVPSGDCPGCGAPFQINDPTQPGYLVGKKEEKQNKKKPQKKLQKKTLSDEEYERIMANLDEEGRALLGGSTVTEIDMKEKERGEEQVKQQTLSKRIICQRCQIGRAHV